MKKQNKKSILATLLICALFIVLPQAAMAEPSLDQDKDQDQIKQKDQDKEQIKLQDGSCQTVDVQELLAEIGAM